jgi:hypothetical protein
MDARYIMLIFIVILILCCAVYSYKINKKSNKNIEDDDASYDKYDETLKGYQDQAEFNGDYTIRVNKVLFDKFVDKIVYYLYKSQELEGEKGVKSDGSDLNPHLDSNLKGVSLIKNDIQYPSFNKYPNLQIVIANIVGQELTATERVFTGVVKNDKQMVRSYLKTLFDLIGVDRGVDRIFDRK